MENALSLRERLLGSSRRGLFCGLFLMVHEYLRYLYVSTGQYSTHMYTTIG